MWQLLYLEKFWVGRGRGRGLRAKKIAARKNEVDASVQNTYIVLWRIRNVPWHARCRCRYNSAECRYSYWYYLATLPLHVALPELMMRCGTGCPMPNCPCCFPSKYEYDEYVSWITYSYNTRMYSIPIAYTVLVGINTSICLRT